MQNTKLAIDKSDLKFNVEIIDNKEINFTLQ
jgi:hypothetical protein